MALLVAQRRLLRVTGGDAGQLIQLLDSPAGESHLTPHTQDQASTVLSSCDGAVSCALSDRRSPCGTPQGLSKSVKGRDGASCLTEPPRQGLSGLAWSGLMHRAAMW